MADAKHHSAPIFFIPFLMLKVKYSSADDLTLHNQTKGNKKNVAEPFQSHNIDRVCTKNMNCLHIIAE